MKLPNVLFIFKDALICAILAAIFLFAVFTVPLPTPLGNQTIGSFQFVAFPTGFAFYQNISPSHFYSISPLDDFVVDTHGGRSTLATLEQLQLTKKTPATISNPDDVMLAVKSYFIPPVLTYKSKGIYPATYQAEFSNHAVYMTRKILNSTANLAVTGMTIKYGQEDFVFDKDGHIYNQKASADIDQFNQFYSVNLSKNADTTDLAALPVKTILLSNPNLSGCISVSATDHQTLWINRVNSAIEVVENVTDSNAQYVTSSMKVMISDTPAEAMKK